MILTLGIFLFTLSGTAGAAMFTDLTGCDDTAAAVYKLKALGIIGGYPDGTFRADSTISRAELAKIVVLKAGLQKVATGMSSLPSQFSDVSEDYWAKDWINIAAAQGFVKGYPDGTFAPDANISQAEVLTVFLRILGYNDKLSGVWPFNYIAKASHLGILDDIAFEANGLAARGEVALMGSSTLEQNVVDYLPSDKIFSEKLPARTLLVDRFNDYEDVVEKALAADVNLQDGKVCFSFVDSEGNCIDKDLAEDCAFVGAMFWLQAAFGYVDYMINDDDDEVCWLRVRDYEVIPGVEAEDIAVKVPGTLDGNLINGGKIEVDGKSYSLVDNFMVKQSDPNGLAYRYIQSPAGTTLDVLLAALPGGVEADNVDLILNENGEIGFFKGNAWPTAGMPAINFETAGIVNSVSVESAKIDLQPGGSVKLDKDNTQEYYILRNGIPVPLAGIQKGDLLQVYSPKYGVDLLIAMNKPLSGKLQSFEKNEAGDVKKITVEGNTFKVAVKSVGRNGGFISEDGGEDFGEITAEKVDNLLGNNVTVMFTPSGKIGAIISQ